MLPKSKTAAFLLRRLRLNISQKITLVYTAVFVIVLFATAFFAGWGGYSVLSRQTVVSVEHSIDNTLRRLEAGDRFGASFWLDTPLLPGVVLRVTDERGEIVFDNDSHYPSIEKLRAARVEDKPFWADRDFELVETKRSLIYFKTVEYEDVEGAYTLYFARTVTAEKPLFAEVQKKVLLIILLGCFIALVTGYLITRFVVLRPIRTMTASAKAIEGENLRQRIDVPPVRDEMAELAKTFNRMLARIETSQKMQQRFVSDASHELRTPVTVILGYADLLKRWGSKDEETLKESIDAIKDEAENMQELIEKLLFLARVDQKRQVLKKERLDFGALLEDVVEKMKLVAKDREVELTANAAGEVWGDRVTLRQMLRIFLDNSIKYTQKGGRITAEARREGDFLKVTLADNGIGIAKEDQEKVFERFYRVDTARARGDEEKSGGTGLGLSIARWIAEAHDIDLNLSSELGKGTAIYLAIPLMGKDSEEKSFENLEKSK